MLCYNDDENNIMNSIRKRSATLRFQNGWKSIETRINPTQPEPRVTEYPSSNFIFSYHDPSEVPGRGKTT